MSLFINPNYREIREKIENLKPIPGYCIFIDIVGSTELKSHNLYEWISYIYNTFATINFSLFYKFNPLKSIGDCLMFYIPESDMKDESPLTLLDSLIDMAKSEDP